jgi:para-nitrobenzyl esterase
MITPNKLVLLIAIAFLPLVAYGQDNGKARSPIVAGSDIAIAQTESGKVRGYIHEGTFVYKGIPYARAERFMPPEKPDAWEGIRSSMAWGPTCPMMSPPNVTSDEGEFLFQHDWGYFGEDCLRLNIWTPAIDDGKKRPVLIWIHGGGYTFGSSQELPCYDGKNLTEKGNIVYVSVNHRLNVLGFTDLSAFGEKYKSSANIGIIDLVAALEWVKSNIAGFGGDPDNVTIFGQSGRGGKVATLMNAPSAKGLFHRAVMQSGWNPGFQKPQITRRIGKRVVAELGLQPAQIDSIQTVPYTDLVAATQRALKKVRQELTEEGNPPSAYGLGLSPTLDGEFLPYETTDPKALALSKDVPLLIGTTKNEFIASLWGKPAMRNAPLDTIKRFIQKKYGDKADSYIAAVKQAYPEDSKPTDLIDVDLMFRRGTVTHANLKSSNSEAPVFMYMFSWQSPVFDGDYKATHCMELPFVFNNIALWPEMTGGGEDTYRLADQVSQAWINFARYGDPNHPGLPKWEAYSEENGTTMFFDTECIIRHHHDKELLKVTAAEPSI